MSNLQMDMPTKDFEGECDKARVVVQAATSTVHIFMVSYIHLAPIGMGFISCSMTGKGDESLFRPSPWSGQ